MAQTALDLLPLAEAKRHLQIPATDTTQDAEVTDLINETVADFSSEINGRIVDDNIVVDLTADTLTPVEFSVRWVRSVAGIAYWTPSQRRAEVPEGTIDPADCVFEKSGFTSHALFPPSPNYTWPDSADWTPLRVTLSVGLQPTDTDYLSVKKAVKVRLAEAYDRITERGPNSISESLGRRIGVAEAPPGV